MVEPVKSTWMLAGLLVFTILVRGGVLWAMQGNLQQDPDAYREIAENLLRHGEFALGKGEPEGGHQPFHPTAYRPPLYPVVLSNLPTADGQQISLAKVAALHLLLGVATVWLTWLTARRFLGRVRETHHDRGFVEKVRFTHPTFAPLLAGLIVACDPILLNQQTLVMTETLATFLAILSLWCLARFDAQRSWFNAALAGGAIGLAVLCRPTFLPWLGLVGMAMLFTQSPRSKVQGPKSWFAAVEWRMANIAALVVVSAAVMSPWVIRNYRVLGKPIATTTHGGYTLALGNNTEFFQYLKQQRYSAPFTPSNGLQSIILTVWTTKEIQNLESLDPKNELIADEAWYAAARLAIKDSPADFLLACLYRLRQLWSPLPHQLTADESISRMLLRYATAAWYCGVYALAAIGIWRLRWRLLQPPWVWGLLLCLAFTAVHTFYWTNLRMRAPLMPFAALVASAVLRQSRVEREQAE